MCSTRLQNIERYLENDKNTELLEVMKKGTIPLKHPALHTFRDADPNAFYLKKHNPSLLFIIFKL